MTGLPKFKVEDMHKVCKAYQLGNQAKHAFPQDRNISKIILEIGHYDICGLVKTMSMGGYKSYVTFIDDHTRKVWVYFMKHKSEVFSDFETLWKLACLMCTCNWLKTSKRKLVKMREIFVFK